MNPKCDEVGSFFFGTLILSAIFWGNNRKNEPDFRATPLQTAERVKISSNLSKFFRATTEQIRAKK